MSKIDKQLRNGSRAIVVLAAIAGCVPPPTAPVPTADAGAKPFEGRGIVGTVTLTRTKTPPAAGVVYLEDAPKEPGVAMSATIDIFHKEFSPFITVITTGGTVTFGNKDALVHHFFSPDMKEWDTGFLQKNETAGRNFDKPGAIALLCNIHPEMLGYLLVIPSTYFGKFGPDGKYVIPNVPAGTYKATAWAPREPLSSQSVVVTETGTVTADFVLPTN
jgi:plastocyanin